jgi:hypothetical protein
LVQTDITLSREQRFARPPACERPNSRIAEMRIQREESQESTRMRRQSRDAPTARQFIAVLVGKWLRGMALLS